jgi:hypothetical protein
MVSPLLTKQNERLILVARQGLIHILARQRAKYRLRFVNVNHRLRLAPRCPSFEIVGTDNVERLIVIQRVFDSAVMNHDQRIFVRAGFYVFSFARAPPDVAMNRAKLHGKRGWRQDVRYVGVLSATANVQRDQVFNDFVKRVIVHAVTL